MGKFIASISLLLFTPLFVHSEEYTQSLQQLRRLVVFPIQSQELGAALKSNLWWDFRKQLSQDSRFVIATKVFLESKEVYQARTKLKISDCVILGKHLDADALITMEYDQFRFVLRTYSAHDGSLLLQLEERVNAIGKPEEFLPSLMPKLAHQWLAMHPSQGLVVSLDKLNKQLQVHKSQLYNSEIQDAELVSFKRTGLGQIWRKDYSKKTIAKLRFLGFSPENPLLMIFQIESNHKDLPPLEYLHFQQLEMERQWQSQWLGKSSELPIDSLLPEVLPKKSESPSESNSSSSWFKIFSGVVALLVLGLAL